jgi:hypothetical protein
VVNTGTGSSWPPSSPLADPHARRRHSAQLKLERSREKVRTELFLEVHFADATGAPQVGYATEISLSGMRIETIAPLPFGAEVTLGIPLPGAAPVEVASKVLWSSATAMKVQFGAMGARETHALTRLLG